MQSFYPEKRNSLWKSLKVQTHCTTIFMMSVYKLIMYVEMYVEVIILLATCATSLFFMACQRPLKFPDRDQYFTLFSLKHPDDPSSPNKFMSAVYLPRKTPLPSFKNHFPFFSAFVLKCTVTQIHVCNCKSCFKIGLEKPGCTELTFNNYCKPDSLTPHQWCIAWWINGNTAV